MTVGNEYLVTETPLIIHDYHGNRYSILPAGVSLYPVVKGANSVDEYIIYINYQPLPGELETYQNETEGAVLAELYLSRPSANFKEDSNKVLTRDDLVYLLQKSTLTKKEFAEVISSFEE